MSHLLPPNASHLNRALAQVAARISTISVPTASLWNAETCPTSLLTWLAAATSVDVWSDAWPEVTKRAVIASSLLEHRRKGTLSAIRAVLDSAGHFDATILERCDNPQRDGTASRDARYGRGGASHWATFKVRLVQPTTRAWAEAIRERIVHSQRLSCELVQFRYSEIQCIRDGSGLRDGMTLRGKYTHPRDGSALRDGSYLRGLFKTQFRDGSALRDGSYLRKNLRG